MDTWQPWAHSSLHAPRINMAVHQPWAHSSHYAPETNMAA